MEYYPQSKDTFLKYKSQVDKYYEELVDERFKDITDTDTLCSKICKNQILVTLLTSWTSRQSLRHNR